MDRYGLQTITAELDDDGILLVTLNRPERRNAIDAVMHHELRELYARIADDAELEVVVITGAGKGFCAGADFKQMQDNNDAAAYDDGFSSLFVDGVAIARNILSVRRPVIAAVNGDAIGLGASLALFSDVVFMASGARIGDPHVAAGLVAGDGGAILWPLLVGVNRAKEYLMTGDLLTAEEAERIGLVNHVVPADQLLDAAMGMARRLAKGAALAIRFNKQLVNKELEDRVARLYDMAFAMEAITFRSADHVEAVAAFGERRAPTFQRGHR
ncbi:MAG TPA: enoyl-CoA hydratase-related protein [Acidimicrobiales bacterium]|nr:enoyl-CoA hydratase-related protein [Acidimicrobiales bacterium]